VPINCGYIGTNDYRLEPGDRAFMINVRQQRNRISYHTVVIKRQNRLKVETDKPNSFKLLQSVSDDVWKRFLVKPRFELSAKGVFRLGILSVRVFSVIAV